MYNSIQNIKNSKKLPLDVDAWKLIASEQTEIIHIELKPNESVPAHINPVDVIFYVLFGSGILETEKEKLSMKTGDSVLVKKHTNRGWHNGYGKVLKLLVIKLL